MSVQVLVENLTTLLEAIRHSGWYHPKMQEELPSLRILRGSCGLVAVVPERLQSTVPTLVNWKLTASGDKSAS